MPLITKNEVKELLYIASTDTRKDTLIDSLIEKVQDFIVRRVNSFIVPNVYVFGSNISFVSSTNSIIDADEGLDDDGFAVGNDIIIQGSYHNNKIFTIASIAAGEITVNESLVDEDSDTVVYIRRIQFTEDIKFAAADFIEKRLVRDKTIASQSLGDHSVTYFSSSLGQKEMLKTFSPFKKVGWI